MGQKLDYRWHLRKVMATREMFQTTDLIGPLVERGITLSSSQVYRLVTERPERLSIKILIGAAGHPRLRDGRSHRARRRRQHRGQAQEQGRRRIRGRGHRRPTPQAGPDRADRPVSNFRAEVESEQALARGEYLLTMTDAHEHTTLAGSAAAEAQRRLDIFADQARYAGTVISDEKRLTRLMHRDDPAIYPGTFATCVSNPDKALCHQDRDSRGTLHPTLGTCRPLDCGNVALTPDNLAQLRTELAQIDDELAVHPSLPPLLQHRLRSRHGQVSHFLDRHNPEPT